jgi:hypothetical protein
LSVGQADLNKHLIKRARLWPSRRSHGVLRYTLFVLTLGLVTAAVAYTLTVPGRYRRGVSIEDRAWARLLAFQHLATLNGWRFHRLPNGMEELLSAYPSDPYRSGLIDEWKTPLRLVVLDVDLREVEIRCAGPNRVMDDADDLVTRFVVPTPPPR